MTYPLVIGLCTVGLTLGLAGLIKAATTTVNLGTADAAVFFERAVWRVVYTGPPGIFSFFPAEGVRGTPAPASIAQTRVTPGHFKLADAAAMISHAQIRSWDTACWVMHQSVIPDLIQMVDNTSSNRLVWMSPFGDGKVGGAAMKLPQAFLNGLPIYFTEKLPPLGTTGDVMLVDWSRYVIGNRMDLQIDVSPHFKFQNNQLAWRVIARCDAKPWLNNYITDASGWQVSPFVALN